MWNQENINNYFSNNNSFIKNYYGKNILLNNSEEYTTKIRIIIKRIAQLMPHGCHNAPGWDWGMPIIAVSRLLTKTGNLDGNTRLIVLGVNNVFYIGFRTNKNSNIMQLNNCFNHLNLNNYSKVYDKKNNHLNFVVTNLNANEEFSDNKPLLSSDFETALKNINFQNYRLVDPHLIRVNKFLDSKNLSHNTPITPALY